MSAAEMQSDRETGANRKEYVRRSDATLRDALDEYLAARPGVAEINRLFTRRDIQLQGVVFLVMIMCLYGMIYMPHSETTPRKPQSPPPVPPPQQASTPPTELCVDPDSVGDLSNSIPQRILGVLLEMPTRMIPCPTINTSVSPPPPLAPPAVTKKIKVGVRGGVALRICKEQVEVKKQMWATCDEVLWTEGQRRGNKACAREQARQHVQLVKHYPMDDLSSVFFTHIPRNSGLRFANTMITLVHRYCKQCSVWFDRRDDVAQTLAVPTMAEGVQPVRTFRQKYMFGKHDHQDVVSRHQRFAFLSREFLNERELHDAATHPFRYAAYSAILLRAPDARLVSLFDHDVRQAPDQMRCARNVEELAECCTSPRGCKRGICPVDLAYICMKYNNYLLANMLGRPSSKLDPKGNLGHVAQGVTKLLNYSFIGLAEAYPASICLFLWQHSYDELFRQDCMGEFLNALPGLDRIIQEHHSPPPRTNALMQKKQDEAMATKADKELFLEHASNFTSLDWSLYDAGAAAFFNRLIRMYEVLGYEVECHEVRTGHPSEERGRVIPSPPPTVDDLIRQLSRPSGPKWPGRPHFNEPPTPNHPPNPHPPPPPLSPPLPPLHFRLPPKPPPLTPPLPPKPPRPPRTPSPPWPAGSAEEADTVARMVQKVHKADMEMVRAEHKRLSSEYANWVPIHPPPHGSNPYVHGEDPNGLNSFDRKISVEDWHRHPPPATPSESSEVREAEHAPGGSHDANQNSSSNIIEESSVRDDTQEAGGVEMQHPKAAAPAGEGEIGSSPSSQDIVEGSNKQQHSQTSTRDQEDGMANPVRGQTKIQAFEASSAASSGSKPEGQGLQEIQRESEPAVGGVSDVGADDAVQQDNTVVSDKLNVKDSPGAEDAVQEETIADENVDTTAKAPSVSSQASEQNFTNRDQESLGVSEAGPEETSQPVSDGSLGGPIKLVLDKDADANVMGDGEQLSAATRDVLGKEISRQGDVVPIESPDTIQIVGGKK